MTWDRCMTEAEFWVMCAGGDKTVTSANNLRDFLHSTAPRQVPGRNHGVAVAGMMAAASMICNQLKIKGIIQEESQ